MNVGDRVEVPVWSDDWMRGDRYGEVITVHDGDLETRVTVRLDKSERHAGFRMSDLRRV